MTTTSATAVLNGLSSSFLTGGKKTQALLGAHVTARVTTPKRFVVAAAAVAPKKSWIPAVKSGGNLVDPEWLDGS